jgi:UrcA family protein
MQFAAHTVRSNRLSRIAIAVLASTLATLNLGLAKASTPAADVPSVVVNYDDLNLATEHGTLALYGRITAAAHRVCPEEVRLDARRTALARACVSDAIARAVSQVNSPKLAELEAARARRVSRG